jgi:hypothetical protein
MKYPMLALLAVAAMVLAPVAADAATKKVHKHHRMVSYHQNVRAAYGMYEPRGILDSPPVLGSPPPVWGSRNAAVDGDNANSMSGPNSAPENPASGG